MAIRNLSNAPSAITSRDKFPQQRCAIRCLEETFGESSKGNMMITRTWEVVEPEAVIINGASKIVAGKQMTQYLPTIVKSNGVRDDEKSDKALARLRDENAMLGLPANEIDDENPQLVCKGIVADAIVGSEDYSPRGDDGKAITYADGSEVKNYRLRLQQILGLSSVKVNDAF